MRWQSCRATSRSRSTSRSASTLAWYPGFTTPCDLGRRCTICVPRVSVARYRRLGEFQAAHTKNPYPIPDVRRPRARAARSSRSWKSATSRNDQRSRIRCFWRERQTLTTCRRGTGPHDPATRTRFIPVELWTGVPWDGAREIRMAPAACSSARARQERSWPDRLERDAGLRAHQRGEADSSFALRDDKTGLGRVVRFTLLPARLPRRKRSFRSARLETGRGARVSGSCTSGARPLKVTIEESISSTTVCRTRSAFTGS